MIKQFPLSFIIVCALCLIVAYFLVDWLRREALSRKDDLIADLQKKLGLKPIGEANQSLPKQKADELNPSLTTKATIKEPCPDKWTHEIGNYARKQIEKFVLVENCIINSSRLSESKYIDFTFSVFNLSVFSISIPMPEGSTIDNFILFKGVPLSGVAKLYENRVDRTPPTERNNFTIRQWVSPDEATDISETLKTSGNLFDFSKANVYVRNDEFQDEKAIRLDLTRGMLNAALENKIIQLEALISQCKTQISEWETHADKIHRLSLAYGMALQADDIINFFRTPLPKEMLTYLNANIDNTLINCFGAQVRDDYYEHISAVPDSADNQTWWIQSHCTHLAAHIKHLEQSIVRKEDSPKQ